MNKSKPYTIAFISNSFHAEYCNTMYLGIKNAVSELGVSLVTLSGGDLENPDHYNALRYKVFDLINTNDFDGIVFQSGSLQNYTTKENLLKFCSQFNAVPSVHIGFTSEGLSSVLVDSKTGMRELIDHFIEVHNRKEIAFVSGPEGCVDADERLDAYKESLIAHGITFREDLVFNGTFLSESGTKAVNEFIDERKIKFDALVAANDQMALFAKNELIRRGIRVPTDIIVGGFDDLISARASSPALCTVRQPVQELGKEALKLLIDIIEGKRKPGTCVRLPSKLVPRRSCGCISISITGCNNNDSVESIRTDFKIQFDRALQKDESTALEFFENQVITLLKNGLDVNDLLSCLEGILDKHDKKISPDLYDKLWRMLLAVSQENYEIRKRIQQEEEERRSRLIDDMRMISEPYALRELLAAQLTNFGIREFFLSRYKGNGKAELFYSINPGQNDSVFNAKQLIPGGIKTLKAPFNLICLPLFENETDIGFLLCNPIESNFVFLETIRSSLSETFHMIDMIAKEREYGIVLEKKVQERTAELEKALNDLSSMNDKLEILSTRDELTQLFNRRGFLSMASRYISLAKRNKSAFICIFFDLDRLKQINDTYGHAQGDIAIRTIGTILAKSFRKTDVLGRMGGDEFTVLAFECSGAGYEQIVNRIDAAVDEYNKTSGNPWKLGYSSGFASSEQEHGYDIDNLLRLADKALYKVKVEKKSRSCENTRA